MTYNILCRVILTVLLSISTLCAAAWGSKGHQIVCSIAQRHLAPEVYEQCIDIFSGSTLVYYASWMDYAKYEPEYSYTATWHYINCDEGRTYENRNSLAYVDAVQAIKNQTKVLADPAASDEKKDFALKTVIHCVGDMHQPLHAGHASDSGGNTIYLDFLGTRTSLHSIWDSGIINNVHKSWSYYDWSRNIDCLDEETVTYISSGNIDDWGRQCVQVAADIYRGFPAGETVDEAMIDKWAPVVERQLLRGGLRLAALLNGIFANAGVDDPIAETSDCFIYYNLQGIPVGNDLNPLPRGIYIRSDGHKVFKK